MSQPGYRCEHFLISELISPATFRKYGQSAWDKMDWRLLTTLDAVRDRFGPTVINNWLWGGSFKYRGLRADVDFRELKRQGIYLPNSQHVFGRAADMHFKDVSVEYAREYILSHPKEFPYVKGIEIAPWLHLDVRDSSKVIVFGR